MPYQPGRLRELRKAKNLSILRLSELSKVSARTIQRLENAKDGGTTPHPSTVERLAKALRVQPEALVGGSPPDDPATEQSPAPERVQIGALIAPKARLAYDLVRKRYGVNATEIINVAPLFFALLAEASLAKRRERTREARDSINQMDRALGSEALSNLLGAAAVRAEMAVAVEEESIAKADVFGEHLLSCDDDIAIPHEEPFDPAICNPFADYLRQLAAEVDNAGVVDTKADLSYGWPCGKFPDYDICSDEVGRLANGSADARRALELGGVRLSQIPDELLAEDAGAERATWLAEQLPETFRDHEEIAGFAATRSPNELKALLQLDLDDEIKEALGFETKDEGGPRR